MKRYSYDRVKFVETRIEWYFYPIVNDLTCTEWKPNPTSST